MFAIVLQLWSSLYKLFILHKIPSKIVLNKVKILTIVEQPFLPSNKNVKFFDNISGLKSSRKKQNTW